MAKSPAKDEIKRLRRRSKEIDGIGTGISIARTSSRYVYLHRRERAGSTVQRAIRNARDPAKAPGVVHHIVVLPQAKVSEWDTPVEVVARIIQRTENGLMISVNGRRGWIAKTQCRGWKPYGNPRGLSGNDSRIFAQEARKTSS